MAEQTQEETGICKFFLKGRCCFGEKCRNANTEEDTGIIPKVSESSKQIKKDKKDFQEKKTRSSKLPPMKTSRDVIARLQWDDELPSEHFVIGYLDRFVGVIEQPFSAFDWTSDLASVDQNVLAIPQHRIQYFKYRGHKLWDKNERLDLIFGSTETSCSLSVPQLLKSIDEQLLLEKDLVFYADSLEEFSNYPYSDKPTHFLAVQIKSPDLTKALQNCINQLLKQNQSIHIVPVSQNLYHITISMLRLETIEKKSQCKRLLESLSSQPFFIESPASIEISGLGTYSNRVLYAKVATNQQFSNTVMSILSFLKANGVCVLDIAETFHISLLKGYKCLENVDQEELVKMHELQFGSQPLDYIHLCSLREVPDSESGFYKTVASIRISNSEHEL